MEMSIERLLDELIVAGWRVLETDFDEKAFFQWRRRACDCLEALLEPNHPYLRLFQDHVEEAATLSLLAGGGILYSLREQVTTNSD